jgi:hypothetical protein
MTFRQWITHLVDWLWCFPRWSINTHCTTGRAGSGVYKCLICDYIERDEEIIEAIEADD